MKVTPKQIFEEYKNGVEYKSSLGSKGIFEQSKMNERFYVGDQWYGAQAGNSRPLVRLNMLKRIGEYKISAVGAAPVAVNYSADGIPDTADLKEQKDSIKTDMYKGVVPQGNPESAEISVIMQILSDYQRITAERVKLNFKCEQVLRNAYISGTGFLYTYWNSDIETGLYADEAQTSAIKGDIECSVLDVENVNLGDPNNDNIQTQPFIIISQRKPLADVKREAKKYRQNTDNIKADEPGVYYVNSGDRGETEPENSKRVTVLTKMWKEYDEAEGYVIKAIRVTETAVIRPEWDMKLHLYPIAKFTWEPRRSCGYGDSEVTYLIPNQIAVNRALTSSVWASVNVGTPKMIVNRDAVQSPITNDPGQIIEISSADRDVTSVISYLQPPAFAGQLQNFVNDLINNTLTNSGANDAALGNLRPDNASAIIQMREAALQPMQLYQNRYYQFIEDLSRIWADFWLNLYGNRSIKTKDKDGVRYVSFNAERYKRLVITAKVDVGASTLWSEAVVVSTLGGLLESGIITPVQYLERLPKGLIPDITGLINEFKERQQTKDNAHQNNNEILKMLAEQYPEEYAKYMNLPPEQQQAMLEQFTSSEVAQ